MNEHFNETHEIFKASIKILGRPYLSKLWGKSIRHLYAWAADPEFCEYRSQDPLKKINIMLSDLQKQGHLQVVESALSLMTRNLNYDVISAKLENKKNKDSFVSEFFKTIFIMGSLANKMAEYNKKKPVSEKDKNEIKTFIEEIKRRLISMEQTI